VIIAVISPDLEYVAAARATCASLMGGEPASTNSLHLEVLAKARNYLERRGKPLAITLVEAATLEEAATKLAGQPLAVLLLGFEPPADLEAQLEKLYAAVPGAIRSPYSVLLHRTSEPWASGIHTIPDRVVERVRGEHVHAEQLGAIMDFVERTLDRPRNHKAALREMKVTLGDELVNFLASRVGPEFLLLYYTGSSVTPLIDYCERAAEAKGAFVLRAANEHGLACGALANHLLAERPFLAIIGLAMGDEFRGALANLREARVRGFIVLPEAELEKRFTFQGTINADEDVREVLAARRIPFVYLDKTETLPERLEEAYRLFDAGKGPVYLLTAPWLLSASEPMPRRANAAASIAAQAEPDVSAALEIINRGPARVLWQLSHMSARETEMVRAISDRAGIALADTLGHPGPTHHDGKPITNHLGTIGLYGFNQRSYAFLHDAGGKLRPKPEHAVFFLKSRVGERATSFTPARREALRMIQVTDRSDHVAPDVELAIVGKAEAFLAKVVAGLDVAPELLREREANIVAATISGDDPGNRLPSVPMSNNYFFTQLGALFGSLIHAGYTYTPVYDVGRASVSSARAVPRTDHGYAGWYGRALMGDAPASLPILALTSPGNVVAFIGDGGKSIVADPIPALLDNALADPRRFGDRNVTVFYFSNGTYSGIRTYRERLSSRWGGRQMRTIDLLDVESSQAFGEISLVRRRIVRFDADVLRNDLLAKRRVNVLTVVLGHNNDDDGFTFVTSGWRRDAGKRDQ
jgi:thiamine pyrophosphate-dependent acetolactate synthase large subunit-like protein